MRRRTRLLLGAAGAVGVVALWILQGVVGTIARIDDYAAYWVQRAGGDGELLYVALGDSAAQGVGASRPDRGYVGLLAERLAATTGRTVRVVNLSLSGARSGDVLRDQIPRLAELRPDVVTLAVGGNDVGRTAAATFRRTMDEVAAALPPGAFVADVPDFLGGPRRAEARTFAAIVREVVAARRDLVPVELERGTGGLGWRDFAPDFFHPDDSGYAAWADAFWAAMAPRVQAPAPGARSK